MVGFWSHTGLKTWLACVLFIDSGLSINDKGCGVARMTVAVLRVLLVIIFTGALLAQAWFFPTLAAEVAASYPELAWLRWPLLAVVVLAIAGAQVALVAVWVLLAMVESDTCSRRTRSAGLM